MKALCIYHGNCADGFGAAWAVREGLTARGGECDSVEQMLADFPEYGKALALISTKPGERP